MKNLVVAFLFFAIILLPKINYASHASGMDLTYECLTSDTVWSSTQVVINTAAWGNECSWNIVDANTGAVIASGNSYNDNSIYTINVCLPTGNYTFNWLDSFGDGWNGGSYNVTTNTGAVLTSGSPPTGSSGSSSFTSSNACTYTVTNYPANTYRVTLKFYRDCSNGIAAPSSFSLDYNSNTCGSNNSVTMNQVSFQNITPTCAAISDPCNAPGVVGIEEYIYQATITLPNNCNDWILSVCEAARNNAITTINNPGFQNLCVQSELNNTSNYNNNSPIFTAYPTPYLCVGQQYCYNNGATDPDGDSLVYSLVTPLNTAPGGTINYNAGFSAFNPISGTTTFDSFTGDLCMLSNQVQVSVVAMKVSEFRNEIFIGSVIRDIQIIVLNNCATLPPVLTGINGSPEDVTTASTIETSVNHCSNGIDPVVFTINASLGASNNKVMSWNGLSGTNPPANTPTFSVISNNTSNPSGIFNWIPDYADVLNSPFYFTVSVEDDACPINNLFSFTYTLNLTSNSSFLVSEIITKESCPGDNDGAIDITITGISGVPTFSWTGPNGFTSFSEDITSLEIGTYNLTITAPDGCETYYIYDVLSNSVNLSETNTIPLCNGSLDGEIDLTVIGGVAPLLFVWEKLDSLGNVIFISNSEDLTNLSAGTYSVTVSDAVFCSNNISITLTEPSQMVANGLVTSDYNGSNISCNGDSDGIITAQVSGGNGSYTYSIDQLNYTSTQIFSALNENIYTISYKDDNGCTTSEIITLNNPSPININLITKEDISCYGSADGSIDITATGGTQNTTLPLYNYSWTDTTIGFSSNTEDLLIINQPGTYRLTITDANSCPSSVFIENISEPTEIEGNNNPPVSITCFGASDGIISLVANGGNPPYTFDWIGPNAYSNSQNTNPSTIFQLNTGDYDYTITDSKGCSFQSATSIYVFEPSQINVVLIPSLVTCSGVADGSVNLLTNISFPLFEWTSSADLNYFETSEDITGLDQGVYTVKVTDPVSLCFQEESVTISVLTPYNIYVSKEDEKCYNSNDGEILLTPNSTTTTFTSYEWLYPDGSTNNTEDIDSLSPGLYQLQVSYALSVTSGTPISCTANESYNILPAEEILVSPSLSLVSCEGGNDGGIALGNLSGGFGNFTYLWSNAELTKDINNLTTGTYSVTIFDENNCTLPSIFNLTSIVFDTLSVLKNNILCKGDSTGSIDINGITGGTYPYSFSWTGPNGFSSNNEDLTNLYAGAYQVDISDATGCQIYRYIILSETPQALDAIPAFVGDAKCNGSSDGFVVLEDAFDISGGTPSAAQPYYEQDWGSANPDSLSAGNYNYTIYDSNNCFFKGDVTINEPPLFTITPFVTKVKCPNKNTGSISILIDNLTGAPTIEWTGPNDIITNQIFSASGLSINNLYAGNYNCLVTDDSNCTVQQTIYVSEPYTRAGSPLFLTSNNTSFEVSCKGGSDAWIEVTMAGGDYSLNTYEYLWENGETSDSIFSLSADTLGLTVIDSINCSQEFSYIIREPDSLVSFSYLISDYNNYNISCYNASDGFVELDATGGVHNYSYIYYINDILDSNFNSNILSNLKSDNLFIIIKDNNGCQYSDTINLIQPELLKIELNLSPDTCSLNKGYADVIVSGGVPNYSYSWSNGSIDFFSDNLSEGSYDVTVIDANKCDYSESFEIYNLPSPKANFSLNPSHKKFDVQLEEPFVFIDISETFTQKIKNRTWYFSDNSLGNDSIVQHSFSEIGEYQVLLEIETEYNCFDTISKSVVIDNYNLWIPDTFTPNDDGVNDSFKPYGVGIKEYKIQIFSRWGELIFFSEDINSGWDGMSKNNNKSMKGIFTYYIEIVNVYNEFFKYDGTIKLIR
jgi:gliding motility-associated-like protein